jgi:P4 family phage/plasmid primase-like protien
MEGQITMITSIKEFILSKGYDFEVEIINGKWQKTTDKNGHKVWYVGTAHSDDHTTFSFGDYRDPDEKHFFTTKVALTEEDEAKQKKFAKKVLEDKSLHQEIAKELVSTLWNTWAKEDAGVNADYLIGKKLPRPPGVIVRPATESHQQVLVVPLYDFDGELWNIQQIYAGGDKAFHPGAKIKECFFTFKGEGERILIGEGFATCLAAHLATRETVICAFNISNLESAVRETLGLGVKGNDIVLLADFDGETNKRTGKNPGMLAAKKLTEKYQCRWASPVGTAFHNEENVDFADLWMGGENLCRSRVSESFLWSDLKDLEFSVPKEPKKKSEELEVSIPADGGEKDVVPYVQPVASGMPMIFEAPKKLEIVNETLEFPTKESGFFRKEMNSKKQMVDVPDFVDFSKWMAFDKNLKANDAFNFLYDDGYYQRLPNMKLQSITQALVKENTAPHVINQFVNSAKNHCYVDKENLVEPPGLINLKNGILDVRNKRLQPHSPEYFFKYKLPHEYIEGAECPEWLKFLERTFEGNQELVDLCAEIFGYVILGGEPFLHKAIVLSGDGRNGKSTFLDVLKYMIGRTNFSSIPISQLQKPFSVVMADGMLANIVGETTAGEINSEAFKTAVSGEELIASQKGMPEYPLAFNARLILACNKLPHLGDATAGAYEKFLILPFNRYIQAEERIALFAKRHLFPEVSGVINWALRGLDRLILRGMLPEITIVQEQNIELREEIDSVFAWMQGRVNLTYDEKFPVLTVKIKNWYPNYEQFCVSEKRNSIGPLQFSKRIMAEVRKHPHLRITRPQNSIAVTGRVEITFNSNTGAGLPC